ncbi:serine hydrolase [Tahibacter soli]|uniref:Serine hydrolase n=1 Tax=Tahibacter soli TaxID=2983605 RepID=A0A9X3YLL5_9GAMM|nr:serine hydrolase [Tahibacter soli]MDC8014676.1 serine hydrolase [Tahibacter soli]
MTTKRRGRWAALAGACALAASLATAQTPPATDGATNAAAAATSIAANIDAYLQAAVRDAHFSGSVLVARDGVPLFDASYGLANIETGTPNTPSTIFRIASLTKQFTAMAILQLEEQGKLKVDDPICRYLADCPKSWRPITLHHLLTHTSGIRNFSSLPDWDEDLGLRRYRRDELVDLVRGLPLEFTPGEKHKYSNSGYHLLGLAIERASGKTYAQYLHDAIFAPLGMLHTAYTENRELVPGRATGYYSRGTRFVGAPFVDPTASYAAGGLTSTTGDLLRWDQALYADTLVSRASRERMFTAFKDGYAYGWRIGEAYGRRTTEHSGSLNGFSSYLLRFPDARVTVIVLGNSDRMSAGRAGRDLAAIVFGAPYAQPARSARDVLWTTIVDKDAAAAIAQYQALARAKPDDPGLNENMLLHLGYDLFEDRRLDAAAAIFDFTLATFPTSSGSYDGMAEIALDRGDRNKAAALFKRAVALDADDDYATYRLARLKRGGKAD